MSYDHVFATAPRLVGLRVYEYSVFGPVRVPLGDDSVRWVPQLSPLAIQSSMVVSRAAEALGAPALTYSYRPFRGERHSITFAGAARPHLDFWWLQGGTRALLASLGALVSSVAAATLALRCRRCDSSSLPS